MTAQHPSAVPTLVDLACEAAALELDEAPPAGVEALSPPVRARLLHHAIAAGTLADGALRRFGASELDLRGSHVTDRGLGVVGEACGAKLLRLDLSRVTPGIEEWNGRAKVRHAAYAVQPEVLTQLGATEATNDRGERLLAPPLLGRHFSLRHHRSTIL